jgi:N-acetylneuraminic acid mutarotase
MNDTRTSRTITWRRGPDIPLPRGGYYAAWRQGGLLLAGGTYWEDGKKLWTDEVSFFDPVSELWERRPPLPRPLGYGSMIELEGRLFLFGGSDDAQAYRDIYVLDAEQWEQVGEMPASVQYTLASSVGRRAILIGGTPLVGDLTQATGDVWAFDPVDASWEALAPLLGAPRALHATTRIDDSVFIFGGCTRPAGAPLQNLAEVWRFDVLAERWVALSPAPVAARSWSAVAVDGVIYLFGGYGDRFLDSVYCFDPLADRFEQIGPLPQPLADIKFFYNTGRFYVAAGEHAMAARFSGTLIGTLE